MTRCLQATGYFGIQEKIEPVFGVEGGFQLESLSINRVINPMICYKFESEKGVASVHHLVLDWSEGSETNFLSILI